MESISGVYIRAQHLKCTDHGHIRSTRKEEGVV